MPLLRGPATQHTAREMATDSHTVTPGIRQRIDGSATQLRPSPARPTMTDATLLSILPQTDRVFASQAPRYCRTGFEVLMHSVPALRPYAWSVSLAFPNLARPSALSTWAARTWAAQHLRGHARKFAAQAHTSGFLTLSQSGNSKTCQRLT